MQVTLNNISWTFGPLTVIPGLDTIILPRLLFLRTLIPGKVSYDKAYTSTIDGLLPDITGVTITNDVITITKTKTLELDVDQPVKAFYIPRERYALHNCTPRSSDLRLRSFWKLLHTLTLPEHLNGNLRFSTAPAIQDWVWERDGFTYNSHTVPMNYLDMWLWEAISNSVETLEGSVLIVEEACVASDLCRNRSLLCKLKGHNFVLWGNCSIGDLYDYEDCDKRDSEQTA